MLTAPHLSDNFPPEYALNAKLTKDGAHGRGDVGCN